MGRAFCHALHRKVRIFGKVFSIHNFVQKGLGTWKEVDVEAVCCCRLVGHNLLYELLTVYSPVLFPIQTRRSSSEFLLRGIAVISLAKLSSKFICTLCSFHVLSS
ncbi:uncharacterized protein J3R85_004050 [Psidium guajava]|nr:uncharacterized protein J3R85_004050 [Psidium guajava]